MTGNRRGHFQCLSYYDTFYIWGQRINANFLPTNKYIHSNINSKMKEIITVLSIDQMEPLWFRFWLEIHSLSFLYNLFCHHPPASLTSKSQWHLKYTEINNIVALFFPLHFSTWINGHWFLWRTEKSFWDILYILGKFKVHYLRDFST